MNYLEIKKLKENILALKILKYSLILIIPLILLLCFIFPLLLIIIIILIIFEKYLFKKIPNMEKELKDKEKMFENERNKTLTFENNKLKVDTYLSKEYKIAGVTYENEDGKNIQKEIKKILKEYVLEGFIDEDDMYLRIH